MRMLQKDIFPGLKLTDNASRNAGKSEVDLPFLSPFHLVDPKTSNPLIVSNSLLSSCVTNVPGN